jgi:predicted extracellular nuclease
MRFPLRSALALLIPGMVLMSCSDSPMAPLPATQVGQPLQSDAGLTSLVISQVYGGGGNSGATLKNDFIEIFNPTGAPISVAGWSVQYASATGTSWAVTALSGTIAAGGYQLIQEAAGTGGTTSLPTPDASGSIAMAAGAGKVALSSSTAALAGTCPSAPPVVDRVSFGTTATDCGFGTTATLTNTTAALRNTQGCTYTGFESADFSTGAPTPRNSASPAHPAAP